MNKDKLKLLCEKKIEDCEKRIEELHQNPAYTGLSKTLTTEGVKRVYFLLGKKQAYKIIINELENES